MALRVETNPLEAAYAALLSHGLDGAGEALRILVDEASKIERSYHLQAAPHERSEDRTGYANGFKPKTILTRRIGSGCKLAIFPRTQAAKLRSEMPAGRCELLPWIDADRCTGCRKCELKCPFKVISKIHRAPPTA